MRKITWDLSLLAWIATYVVWGACTGQHDLNDEDPPEDDAGDDDTAGDEPVGDWIAVSALSNSTCGVRSNGSVECWGAADSQITDTPDVAATTVATGWAHACAIHEDGALDCWGCFGEDYHACDDPAGNFVQVDAGASHSCAVGSDSTLTCWGDDTWGQSWPPYGEYVSVATSSTHSCGVDTSGSLRCWGAGLQVDEMPIDGPYRQVATHADHSCGLREDGSVECWGCELHVYGGCEPPEGAFAGLAVGTNFSCGITAAGPVECWGLSDDGRTDPPQGEFTAIDAGEAHACGITVDGDLLCWGNDDFGQCSGGETYLEEDYLDPPDESGFDCADQEPNDGPLPYEEPLVPEAAQVCSSLLSGTGLSDGLVGTLEVINPQGWNADSDMYRFTMAESGVLHGSLDWDSTYADLHWYLSCYFEDEWNPLDWYYLSRNDTPSNKPEQGDSNYYLSAGTECIALILADSGDDGMGYRLDLWVEPS